MKITFCHILLAFCLVSVRCPLSSQTPYDACAPEMYRPMIHLDAESNVTSWHEQVQADSTLYVVVVDTENSMVMLYNHTCDILLASAPLDWNTLMWLSVDPLHDKNISESPYLYCSGNPVMRIDPTGMDWYENEDGTAVLWKNSNDASINIDGVIYNNIGESYNHTIGNTTYGYHQNELASIEYTTNTEFIKQQKGDGCKVTCNAMVESAGYTPELGRAGEILMATHDANGVVNGATKDWQQGVNRLDDYIQSGMPCIVGVDYKDLQQHNFAPNGDGMTDHFITVIGMNINIQKGSISYRFYDPGSVHGASPSNVMTIVGTFLWGKTAAHGNPFKVTTVRKNKQ